MATCTTTSDSAAVAVTRPASSRRLERENHFRPRVDARGPACVFMSTLLSAGPPRARRTADAARAEAFIPAGPFAISPSKFACDAYPRGRFLLHPGRPLEISTAAPRV